MRQDKTALLVDAAGAVLHADVAGYQDLMFDKRRDEVVEETDVTGADVLFHRLRYKPVQNRTIRNNGHAVQADGGFGSFILLDGEYQAKQFRFHVPSEHSVGGQHAAAEPRSAQSAPLRDEGSGPKCLLRSVFGRFLPLFGVPHDTSMHGGRSLVCGKEVCTHYGRHA
uniref:Uncharacterized protein n=1 Tax=Alexandrium monilatum TaxID=311494 RepID=A0A6T1MI15_9DINO